jgi:ParE-like toxin of type II ParDE toxin-antitoxin system
MAVRSSRLVSCSHGSAADERTARGRPPGEGNARGGRDRRGAPDLFVAELERTLAVVALMPTLGAPARSKRLRDVRRVLLKKTRYHVYYRVHGDVLEVLAV